jgi:hypothetical protein
VVTAWNSNATNANRSSDRIGALLTTADLVAGDRFGIGRNDALHVSAHVGADWWPRFGGLFQSGIGGRAEWRHKFGLGAMVPVLSAELAVDVVSARERDRRGTASGVTLGLTKRFDDAMRATLTHELAEHAARGAAFDRRGAETALEVDRDMSDVLALSFRASYRDGDVLSHGTPPRPDLVALAPNRTPVTTFGPTMVAYSIESRSIALRLALTRSLGQSSAVTLGYEWRDTRRTPLVYVNHLVTLALVHQF